uniref:DRBM domain-containing protein n=1 Tax=Timema poppense TaxID=170557 RepID=A0A7R9HAN3_TIMPO|nr:unnamed protein product [Timema poppensis]
MAGESFLCPYFDRAFQELVGLKHLFVGSSSTKKEAKKKAAASLLALLKTRVTGSSKTLVNMLSFPAVHCGASELSTRTNAYPRALRHNLFLIFLTVQGITSILKRGFLCDVAVRPTPDTSWPPVVFGAEVLRRSSSSSE